MASTRRSSRRAEKGHAAAEDHGTCWLCNGVTTMDDYDWLCLCTSEKKRVHKVCVTHRSSLGGPALKPCPHCGMGNSAAEIEHARASSRVVIVGAGAAGLAAARWLQGVGGQAYRVRGGNTEEEEGRDSLTPLPSMPSQGVWDTQLTALTQPLQQLVRLSASPLLLLARGRTGMTGLWMAVLRLSWRREEEGGGREGAG